VEHFVLAISGNENTTTRYFYRRDPCNLCSPTGEWC